MARKKEGGQPPKENAPRHEIIQRPMDEVFPWDHIGCGTRKEHLKHEWERSREAAITPDCMHQCAGCGASALLKGGKCHV